MTTRVDYDRIAARYDGRYERNDYSGIEAAVLAFAAENPGAPPAPTLEVGCGTGHWLQVLAGAGVRAVGLDLSAEMLTIARRSGRSTCVVRARAEAVPCRRGSFDRLLCVNALHHFGDPAAFFREASRVLRGRGRLLTIGLDPHAGTDRWWIYDYFPSALARDRQRYLPAERIRALMTTAGFADCETREVQHLPARMTVSEAARRGFLDRAGTSQLMVISQDEFDAGLRRLHTPAPDKDRERLLVAYLHVYGTSARAV
ncbi:MAG: class I SAM-dependent methyltransferase [Acidobacteria bacterium]|nr:class I SAM-dependent methyltransferase [Acidobacteriota bacterium]